jgi:hypothetical protein
MSRTRRGAKGPGYEYWGTRGWPTNRMASPGPGAKASTHRAERRLRQRSALLQAEEVCTGPDGIEPGVPLRQGGRRQPLPER